MKTVPCPVCFDGKIPVDFDFYPYHDELDCPYCNGKSYLDPDDPDDARTIVFLESENINDPDFQERATSKAMAKAAHTTKIEDGRCSTNRRNITSAAQ